MNTTDTVFAEVVLDVASSVKLVPVFNATMELSHTRTAEEVFQYFDVKENIGLSDAQVLKARETYGLNGKWSKLISAFMIVNIQFYTHTELPVEEGGFVLVSKGTKIPVDFVLTQANHFGNLF